MIGTYGGGPYQAHEVQPIEQLHMPVDDNHIGVKMLQLLESLRGVSRLANMIDAQRMQDRSTSWRICRLSSRMRTLTFANT